MDLKKINDYVTSLEEAKNFTEAKYQSVRIEQAIKSLVSLSDILMLPHSSIIAPHFSGIIEDTCTSIFNISEIIPEKYMDVPKEILADIYALANNPY